MPLTEAFVNSINTQTFLQTFCFEIGGGWNLLKQSMCLRPVAYRADQETPVQVSVQSLQWIC